MFVPAGARSPGTSWDKNSLFRLILFQFAREQVEHPGTKIGFFAHFCSAERACERNRAEQTWAFFVFFRTKASFSSLNSINCATLKLARLAQGGAFIDVFDHF
jgi:hypothetical protein